MKEVFRGGNRFIFGISVIAAGRLPLGYDTWRDLGSFALHKAGLCLGSARPTVGHWIPPCRCSGRGGHLRLLSRPARSEMDEAHFRHRLRRRSTLLGVAPRPDLAVGIPGSSWASPSVLLPSSLQMSAFAEQTPAKIPWRYSFLQPADGTLGILVAYFIDFPFKGV